MSRHGIPIGRIFGISIDLDLSWFLIVGLLAWMLAASYFPAEFAGWSRGEYWGIGIVTALMLFVSVLIHELAHSLAAKHYGIPVSRITLFLFGGVSQIAAEPPDAAAEFWIAVVGPITSFALAALFWEIEPVASGSQPAMALVKYLALLNLVLAIFNLIPGFPLDGGRVFRAIYWQISRNYHRATMAAGVSGRFFGFVLIFWGVWQALFGHIVNGIWIAFIGWYLESAAGSQMQMEALRDLLGGSRVTDAMRRDFAQLPSSMELEDVVDRYLRPMHSRYALVTDPAGRAGMVTLDRIRDVPRDVWQSTPAGQVMVPLERIATTEPDEGLWAALEKMTRSGGNLLAVVDEGGIVGVLSREDILHYIAELRGRAA
jgi:Zn-dependent protease/CBS domain-containing protein